MYMNMKMYREHAVITCNEEIMLYNPFTGYGKSPNTVLVHNFNNVPVKDAVYTRFFMKFTF